MEEKKGQRFYSRFAKLAVLLQQMICVAVFGIFAALAGYLIYNGNIEDLISDKSYEESQKCINNVAGNVASLENYMGLQGQFETDGIYDDERTVDIMNLDETNTKKKNESTTYRLKDLRELSDTGMISELLYVVEESDYYSPDVIVSGGYEIAEGEISEIEPQASVSGYSEQFQMLYDSGIKLETRLPISGIPLAEYAAGDTQISLRDLYTNLTVAAERLEQYRAFSTLVGDSGNFRYFVYDLKNDMVHSNGDWGKDIEMAWEEARDWYLAVRYTRTPDKVIFDEAGSGANSWLGELMRGTTLAGDQEEVIIALNTTYPVSDVYKTDSDLYNEYQPAFIPFIILVVLSFLAGMVCFVIATIQTGRTEKGGPVQLNGFDRIPTEVAAAMVCVAAVLIFGFGVNTSNTLSFDYYLGSAILTVCVMLLGAVVFMWAYLSLVRRMKAKSLWKNSILRTIINMCKKVYAARTTSRKLIIVFAAFFVGHILLIGVFQIFGVFLAVIIDILILLYLIKEAAGRQTVKEGLAYIASGDLEYKIDVSTLQGDNLEMAEAVNRVGEGLQKAVEKSMKDERMRSELITNVSHDIKTPLTSIINYVDLLKRENIEDETIENYIRILDMKSQRLKQLTEDLVEASKVSSGNIELNMTRIQIQELLQQAYGETEEKLRNKDLEIIFNSIEEPAVIWADGRQLWRIFENLLNNIAKYALANTRVYIDLRIINRHAVLTFKNISEQALNISADELTERFTRGDVSRTTEGSGLGLSIAKSLTELQKGTFEIYLDGDLFKVTVSFELLPEEQE